MDLATSSPATAGERFDTELRRTVDRVRGLALLRLEAGYEPEGSRAAAVRALAQRLAHDAADLAAEPRRVLPVLAPHAAGDQLAVCGHDLRAAADATAGGAALDAAPVLDAATDALLELRRRL
jgi:hypothetical protein